MRRPTPQRRQRRGPWLLPFSLVTAACAALLGCPQSSGPPHLVLAAPVLDLGRTVPGETLIGTVAVKNDGGQVLHVHQIEAGCGCASAALGRAVIPPGERTTLEVTVPIHEEGEERQFTVILRSNDPASPEAVLSVRAAAAPPLLRSRPAEVDFGEIPAGGVAVKRVVLLRPDGQPWPASEPIRAQSERSTVQVALVRGGEAGADAVLKVRAPADLPLGAFADTLFVQPAGETRRIAVPARGRIVPLLVVSPNTLFFGDVDPHKGPMQRFVSVRRSDGQAVPRLVRSAAPPGIAVEEESTANAAKDGNPLRLRITLDPARVNGDLKDGQVRMWLEAEEQPLTVGVLVIRAQEADSAGR